MKKLQKDIREFFRGKGATSSVSIAKLVKMSQPTVYRSLYQDRPKLTKGLLALADYSKINVELYFDKKPEKNEVLMDALKLVWNGTDAHAKQLRKLLLSAHSCKLESGRT